MQKKKAPDRTYGEKLISLFAKLLFTGNKFSLTDLSRSLKCSKQTVLRLLDDITLAYDVPLREEVRGNRKYVWIEKGQRGEGLEAAALLTESEHRMLQMCRAFTEHLLGDESFREAERALEKAGQHLPPTAESAGAMFGIVRSGIIEYSRHEDLLRTLLAGMEQRLVCEIEYQSLAADAPKRYRIKPLKVFAHRETVYVHARKAKTPGEPYRTPKYDPLLALQRFRSVTLTDVKFRRPAGYDFEKVINQGFGVWNQKKFRVELELTGWAAAYARERVWSPGQEMETLPGGALRLGFWSTSEPEVIALVLSFGGEARLRGPESVVERVRGVLGEVLELYEGEVGSGRRLRS